MAQVLLDLIGRVAQFGGADRFVRLLGQLAGGIANRLGRQVSLAELGLDPIADCGHGFVRDAQAVGSHVGDQADRPGAVDVDPFVKLLGDLHGLLAREAAA